jgi:putative PIN family toxin of toxin-antitoxin system
VLRAVIDPGVLVAALISRAGTPARLLRHWLDGAFDLLVSPALLDELLDVVERDDFRRHFTLRQAKAFIALLRERGVDVPDPQHIEARTRDPGDDYLVALAESGSADVIVSGDKDLTELVDPPVPVLVPREFLRRLERA